MIGLESRNRNRYEVPTIENSISKRVTRFFKNRRYVPRDVTIAQCTISSTSNFQYFSCSRQ